MSRAVIIIRCDKDRYRAGMLCTKLPDGTRIEFKGQRRSLPQNDRLWAMLTDVSRQKDHCGRLYTPEVWKLLFMDALFNQKTQLVPTLNNRGMITCQTSSRDLSKDEMSELIEFIAAWGAENGIVFSDDKEIA
jgi:hypothetical protein